jgi:hypothetical protein
MFFPNGVFNMAFRGVKGGVKVFHCGGGKGDHFFFF